MAGKKAFRVLEKRLEQLGFEYDRTNSSSQFVYVHDSHADLAINPGLDDNSARHLLRKVERALGCAQQQPKRNAAAVKERQAAEREQLRQEAERLERARLQIIAERDLLLDGAGSHLTNAEIRDLERRVREIEKQQREIHALMTERPNAGRERAKHRSGER
ncbi:hypothetical protein ACFJIY_07480 [Pimelobacter simplex]|uniref:hypothetical protein n=1 Tax=Nocardioides simplex TaxID=2045 RepID=UPI00366C3BF2